MIALTERRFSISKVLYIKMEQCVCGCLTLKFSEMIEKEVYVENFKVGDVKDVIVDPEEWKVTHLEIKLTKEASKELLGAKKSFNNVLAISAVGPASKCCTSHTRIDLQVSRGQLHVYLRPP
jgi:sporulation protein YlmC with PRC-barrel domain